MQRRECIKSEYRWILNNAEDNRIHALELVALAPDDVILDNGASQRCAAVTRLRSARANELDRLRRSAWPSLAPRIGMIGDQYTSTSGYSRAGAPVVEICFPSACT